MGGIRERGMWWFGLVLLLKGLSCQQLFSVEPSSLLVPPGDNATLACRVQNMGGECRWQKNNKPVGLFQGKYSLSSEAEGGDCSLTIAGVDLRLDDGEWQCQVTSSSISSQDALVSQPARLTVQVPPSSVSIQSSGISVREGGLLTVTENNNETVTCVTRHSNPAPSISWLLGDMPLSSTNQTNSSEPDSNKWRSEATLQHVFVKSEMGKRLYCVVKHVAYKDGENTTYAKLDIMYKPSVHIHRVAAPILEDKIGSITLTCISESNPPARVMWSKMGDESGPQYKEVLEFNPLTRKHAGTYTCQAENSVGRSVEEKTVVDVLYSPIILSTDPAIEKSVVVHNKTVLSCKAEGNPEPVYEWLQQLHNGQVRKRSYTSDLAIEDVGYEDQGEYSCMASNSIGGERRQVQSEVVRLEVAGVPQVVKSVREVDGITGRDVRIEGHFCSDPMPVLNTWQWDGVVLPAGSEIDGRYKAELEPHPHMADCYISRLIVRRLEMRDGRTYTLNVENKHGRDTVPMMLNIQDPVSMASVIAVVLAILIIFLFVVISLLIAYKKQKLCFKDSESEELKEKEVSLQENTYTNEAYKLAMMENDLAHRHPYTPSTKDLSTFDLISANPNATSLHQPQSLFTTPYYPTSSYYSNHNNSTHSLTSQPPYNNDTNSQPLKQPPPNAHHFSTLPTYNSGNPTTNGLPPPPASQRVPRSNFQIYSQLQYPTASNHGSMKKRKKLNSSTPSLDPSPPPPSPHEESISPNHTEKEYYDQDVRVWSVQYVPEVFSITKKTVKV